MRPQQRKNKRTVSSLQNYLPECFEQRLMLSAVLATPSVALTSSKAPTFVPYHPVNPALPPPDNGNAATPTGFTPQQIESAYSANNITFNGIAGNGAGQTIAIVDAYDYPTALTDLQAFDAYYNLPNPPSFQVLNQKGQTTNLPQVDPAGPGGDDWEGEEALDIEWAHAMAPGANIDLVETNDENQLFQGVLTAEDLPGVSVVSMSWSNDESGTDKMKDSDFTTPAGHQGVTFAAAAGDNGAYDPGGTTFAPQYPASSPNVVGVGGTSLTLNGGTYGSEVVWGSGAASANNGGGGGGISTIEPQPEYQQFLVTQSTTQRTYPDVAMLADPATGVSVYDSYDDGTVTPWQTGVGGTSLATPLFSGVIAIANQGRVANGMTTLDGPSQTLPLLYSLPEADFHDITSGSNGYSAGTGYDLASGRGSVIVSSLVAGLDSPYIGFHVFSDANFNGQQDTGEAGVAGVTVQLTSSSTNAVVATTTTDAYGLYDFTNVAAGSYYVHFVAPAGYVYSPAGDSSLTTTNSVIDSAGNSPVITVTATTDDFDVNAGMYQTGVSINNVTISRPHSGTEAMVFTVTLSPTNLNGASIGYATADGTATVANNDYIGTSGTLYFPAGTTTETITVEAVGNTIIENNVSFSVNLTVPTGFVATSATGTGTILNSNFPAVNVTSPAAQTRSATANLTYAFTVSLSEPAPFAVIVPYTTTDASAVGGVDYTATSGTLTFPAGSTGPQTIDVTVLPGTNRQLNKIFYLTMQASSTVVLGSSYQGTGTILTNAPPAVSVETASVVESLNGITYLPFNVDVAPSLTGPVSINYYTSNGTAVAGTDYQSVSGTLNFTTGRIQQTVLVPVYEQFLTAQSKTLTLTITGPTPTLLIATASATGTIVYPGTTALPFSAKQKAIYTDSLNQRVVVSMKGIGNGQVVFLGSSSTATNAYEIITSGTSGTTGLSISVARGGQTSLTNLLVNGSIGTVSAKTTNILSTVDATGSVNALSLGFVSAGNITIGTGSASSVALSFNRVLNSTITSGIAIRTLTAGAYLDTTGSPTYITAPSVGTVRVSGTFGGTIKTISVASLIVDGDITGGGIIASDSIGSVVAAGITNSQFFAGVSAGRLSLPTASTDFANEKSLIGSIKVTGNTFSNSLIAGWNVGTVSVNSVDTASGASLFGISAAHVGKIKTGGIGFSGKPLQLINPTSMTTVGNFVVDPV